ncbi:hypothetical protein BH09MYX1_BH09MYX1_07410 [soil metagenome]
MESPAETQSYCVEAESWQGALQSARRLRGDDSRMAGFSIDITNEGCTAVDPASRRRFDVKRTSDTTPLTPGGDAPPPSRKGKGPGSKRGGKTPEPATTQRKLPDQTMPMQAVSADFALPPSERNVVQGSAPAAASASAPASTSPQATPAKGPTSTAKIPAQKAPAPAPSKRSIEAPVPPTVISREQNATAEVPLTYREYGFVVPAGTTEDAAAQILLVQYTRIKRSLEAAPAGKLVNLAAFDVMFEGQPPVKPVATLTWKDWRGDPTTSFPRKKKNSSAPPPPAAAAHVAHVAPIVIPPAAAVPVISVHPTSAPASAHPPAPEPAPAPAPAPRSNPPPAPPAISRPPSAPPPAAAPATRPQSNPPPAAIVSSPPSPPSPPSMPPVSGRRRVRGEELIAVLFEAMHDLHFQRDAVAGADFCLNLALMQLPSRFGIVYLYDIDKREYVVVSVRGPQAPSILLRRTPDSEPAFALATRRRRALLLAGADLQAHAPIVGPAASVILAPVMDSGRFLGVIELVDPEDGNAFTDLDANGLSYVAEQLAEFASARGVIVDPERVNETAATKARAR